MVFVELKYELIVFEDSSKKQDASLHIAILIRCFIETINPNKQFSFSFKAHKIPLHLEGKHIKLVQSKK